MIYVAVVAFIVFWPGSDVPSSSVQHIHGWLQELGAPADLSRERVEFGLNVLLFVPLSLLGSLLKPRWTWSSWVVVGYCATVGVEAIQGLLLPQRSPTMKDIVANTGGALIGAVIAWVIRHGVAGIRSK